MRSKAKATPKRPTRRAPRTLPRAGLDQNLAGILEPVFAIRTEDDLGVGDTEGVKAMIDWCHRHGLNIFQTLPINETSNDNSPYNAISSLALEPTTIAASPRHLPDLSAADFRRLAKPDLLKALRKGPVDYPKVKPLKLALLRAAFETFREKQQRRRTARAKEFAAFVRKQGHWLENYSLYRVLVEENRDVPTWEQWPLGQRTPDAAKAWLAALPEFERAAFLREQQFFQYVQWIAFSQWEAVRAHADARGVYLMGDVPFGVGRCSADTWAYPEIFDLDWSGGAPPEKTFRVDVFTEKWGQNWGIPLYDWDALRQRNFDWWRLRVSTLCRVFHIFRIDHVLGFFRVYSFPWTPDRNAEFEPMEWHEAALHTGGRTPGFKPFADDTEEHRQANERQGQELLKMVLEAAGENTVIAEDLGMVPDYVSPALTRLGIPGFRIPMFFREKDGSYSDPKQYPLLTIAQPATHDHPPLAAQWAEFWANIDAGKNAEDSRRELERIMAFAGLKDEKPPRHLTDRVLEHFAKAVLESRSWLVVFQITDVLGEAERFNVPGLAAASNWSNRLPHTVGELDREPKLRRRVETFARLAKESGRCWGS